MNHSDTVIVQYILFTNHPTAVSFCIEIGAKMAPPTMLMAEDAAVVVANGTVFALSVSNDIVVDEVELVLLWEEKLSEKSIISTKMTTGMDKNRETIPHLMANRHGRRLCCAFLLLPKRPPFSGKNMIKSLKSF